MSTKYSFFIFLFTVLVFIGCSKDDGNSVDPGSNDSAPALQAKQAEIPQGLVNEATKSNGNPYAQQAYGYLNLINGITSYAAQLVPPQSKASLAKTAGGPWVYNWAANGISLTLTITETSDSYTWSYVLNGVQDGVTYTNYQYLYAEQKKDGSSGSLAVYDTDGTAQSSWNWTQSSSGTITMTMLVSDIKYVIVSNSDGSGTADYYYSGTLYYNISWTSTGSGSATDYTTSPATTSSWS